MLKRIKFIDTIPALAVILAIVPVSVIAHIRWKYLIPKESSLGSIQHLIVPVIFVALFLFELVLRRWNHLVLALSLGVLAFAPISLISIMTDKNVSCAATRHSCSVQLHDYGVKVTINTGYTNGSSWHWLPGEGGVLMWRAVIERQGYQPNMFICGCLYDLNQKVQLSIIETSKDRILLIYDGDKNYYIELSNLSGTQWRKGKERQLGVFRQESIGKFRFEPILDKH
ncbi:MAG: hypothetical protein ABFD46_06055 [Armatimonadota bacterium]